jgi:translocation and assembly module TamB
MHLNPETKFPFAIDARMQDLNFLNFDIISSSFTGDLTITGNTDSSVVKGSVSIPEATINVAEALPTDVPELEVTYVNKPIHLEGSRSSASKAYPLNYDIDMTANDRVLVKGRGLNSEWKGSLHIAGKNAAVLANGNLTLLKGDFTFSGKKFLLTQGEIAFKDKPNPSAFIKISGTLQMSDVQVIALMQGPLESPSLTFQSIPHMPTSSILARILFNKDITEITAIQAIQIANVIVSMSGSSGPDVLEAIRRSIGVDSLKIIEKDGTDEISVQVGWYLTHGVTISLAQSATSSDVIVEVDLKHGFIFQAETQNQEEGKFSLKWNKNY